MSLFFGRKVERRDLSIPWNYGGTLSDLGGANREQTALGLTAVFAAVRHITDYASCLPLKPYRRVGEDRVPMPSLPRLFADLEAEGRLVGWVGQGMASLVLRGNAVGLITRTDGFMYPTGIEWVHMDRVTVDDRAGGGPAARWQIDGHDVSRHDLVHIPWITVPGATLGLSPLAYYAATVAAGVGAQSYGRDWFKGGGFPPAVFRNTSKTLKPGQADSIRERLVAAIRKREPLVTGADWEYSPITIPPGEAQFIESQKLTATQVAAVYGIEPDELGGEAANSMTYSNEEMRQIKRLANLRPYLYRLEQAFASWLPDRQFVRFNGDAILRADLRTRWEVHKIRHDMGAASINEIRALEDEPPIPGGDAYGPPAPPALPPANDAPSPATDPAAAPARRLSLIDYGGHP